MDYQDGMHTLLRWSACSRGGAWTGQFDSSTDGEETKESKARVAVRVSNERKGVPQPGSRTESWKYLSSFIVRPN